MRASQVEEEGGAEGEGAGEPPMDASSPLGVFVLGASFETAWRVESAQAMGVGGQVRLGG